MQNASRGRAFATLALTFFFWGSVYVGGKLIAGDIPAPLIACLRGVVAMFPLILMAKGNFNVKIAREDYKYFFIVGGLGYFFTVFLVQIGISLTGASTASLINSLTPVSVTIIAAFVLKEKITPVKCLCLFLALAGTAIVTGGASKSADIAGILVVLVSVLCWGTASVYMRRLTAKYPAILVTAYGTAIGLIFHIPVGIITLINQPVNFSGKSVMVILYLGLIGSGVAQYTWTKCLSVLPASTCSLFYPLQAVFSALLGALILKETFHITFFIGLLLITADVAISTWDNR